MVFRDLWEKGKPKKQNYQPVRRIAHPALPSITDRPEHVSQREEYGHWEIDLVVGKAKSKPVLLTLTERWSRDPMIFKLTDKGAASVRKIFDTLERTQPDFRERFKTITTDNGPEFLEYEQPTQSIHGGRQFVVYYCHSYSAWEKWRALRLARPLPIRDCADPADSGGENLRDSGQDRSHSQGSTLGSSSRHNSFSFL